MPEMNEALDTIDMMLDTKKKRHIVGGVLISLAFLLGGLAITALTIKEEDDEDR